MPRKRSSPPPDIPTDDSDHVDAASDDEQPIESDPQNDVAEEQNDDAEEEEESQEDDAASEGDGEDEAPADAEAEDQSVEKQVSSQGSESIGKDSGSDPDPGSGSESGKSSSPVPVKPIRSKPMKALAKKPDPKVAPKPKTKRKRASAKQADKNGKGGGKRARVSNGDEKRSGINRLWSEEDEIVILQGLIDYHLANDQDPFSDLEAFYEFVKDSFHVSVSMKQLSDKLRRLKKKFLVNAEKGNDVVFVKPHEDKSFELSKKIWGAGIGGEEGTKVKGGRKKKDKDVGKAVNNGVKMNGKDNDVMEDEIENGVEGDDEDDEGLDLKAMYPYMSKAWESDFGCSQALKEISMGNFQLISSAKMRGMEKEWKDSYVKEMQFYVNKMNLKAKHAKVVLDQMISSDP